MDTWNAFNGWHIQLEHEQFDVNAGRIKCLYILIRPFQSHDAEEATKKEKRHQIERKALKKTDKFKNKKKP